MKEMLTKSYLKVCVLCHKPTLIRGAPQKRKLIVSSLSSSVLLLLLFIIIIVLPISFAQCLDLLLGQTYTADSFKEHLYANDFKFISAALTSTLKLTYESHCPLDIFTRRLKSISDHQVLNAILDSSSSSHLSFPLRSFHQRMTIKSQELFQTLLFILYSTSNISTNIIYFTLKKYQYLTTSNLFHC